ncbi:ankyrin repeat-containing domain protein [Dunaliella salina]|uniref:Ankyrin repeat-containing domain protein n=1 Tax=Dunaliella salina TaxID=3046 RepID=A0ABQ7GAL5_DUNSA|nr:ankyrin repeat-containing domain protein [Dunaliella salina]|eukprot:KAF5831654.1 ankyrin repeat-containing domain protein [Dunaliella salina]
MADEDLDALLHEASRRGQTARVKELLDCGAAVDKTSENGWTSLHKACRSGHTDVIRLLLSRGADLEKTKHDGYTGLHLACLNGHKDAVLLLLNRGAAVDRKNRAEKTALDLAKEENETAVVSLLESKIQDTDLEASLRIACGRGHTDTARQLLDRGAAVDGADEDGKTPLHRACDDGHQGTAQLLLDRGAAVDSLTEDGWTPLHFACRDGTAPVVELLLSHSAATNAAKDDGYTPLHLASLNRHRDAVQLLLNHKAAVDKKCCAGKTPLDLAKQKNETAVIELLENHMDTDKVLEASLCTACSNGDTDTARQLLDRGAAVNGTDENGWTPLHFSSRSGRTDVIQLLLSRGAAPDKDKNDGYTPLHLACLNGREDAVQVLLDHGAAVDKTCKAGKTPLDLAKEEDETVVIQLLLSKMGHTSLAAETASEILEQQLQQQQQLTEQLAQKDHQLQDLCQQLAEKDRELAQLRTSPSEGLAKHPPTPSDDLLKHPPVRAHGQKECMVCMDTIPGGSIICMQKGCNMVMCQDCATEMCSVRMRSSGSEGNSNGELMCKGCSPSHSILPATIARTVPSAVFQGLQAKLSREPVHGSWRAFMARNCPECQNTAAMAAGVPFFMCTSVPCSSKQNLFCIFCQATWTSGHVCAAPIDIRTVEDMLRQEAAATDDSQLQNVLVRPCPRCPVRICTKDPDACYHMTCAHCDLQYCGVCQYIKNSDGWWSGDHTCVDSDSIYMRSEARRQAVLSAYQEALA